MSVYADEGTAAHQVLEQCVTAAHLWGMPVRAKDYLGQVVKIQDYEHAELSPSGADRWMVCPGSVQMQRPFKEKIDPEPRSVVLTQEYVDAIQDVLDYVAERMRILEEEHQAPVLVYTEHQVDPRRFLGTSACKGTVDITLIGKSHVENIDAKFGAGVSVPASTRQLDLYLLGTLAQCLEEYPDQHFQTARLTIIQPRCKEDSGFVRSRDIEDVSAWRDAFILETQEAIKATRFEPPVLRPDEKACRWCDARGVCSAAVGQALNTAGVLPIGELPASGPELYNEIENFALLEPYLLSAEQIRALLDATQILQATLQATNAFAMEAILTGHAPDEITSAYKVVRKSSHRRWGQDEAETEKRLKRIKIDDPDTGKKRGLGKKDIIEPRLKSIATIEKLLKAFGVPKDDARFDAFRALVEKPEGALTLVPINDARPAVQSDRSPERALEDGPDIDPPKS